MNPLSTLPSAGEQARHALLLLGAPASTRLVADVHAALFDGDLGVPALAGLIRDREPGLAAALRPDLTPARGVVALAEWPLERRIVTPAGRRADGLAMVIRVAEFVAMRPTAGRAEHLLLRELAQRVPHGVEAVDLAQAARVALTAPELAAAIEAEAPLRAAVVRRAAGLEPDLQLYGMPGLPQQRARG